MEIDRSQLEGVYLVIDPAMEEAHLLKKTEQALEGGVSIIQIWNHWPDGFSKGEKEQLVSRITNLGKKYDAPVLINDDWMLLKSTNLDGVHFDERPENIHQIRKEVSRSFITGITCSNDLEIIYWAEEHNFDYVSFCAMFPSPSVDSCEIVQPETVKKAREITDMPLFISGGLTPEKVGELKELDFNGVAVISGIMKSESPEKRTQEFNRRLFKRNRK